jgi:hypothetical protein
MRIGTWLLAFGLACIARPTLADGVKAGVTKGSKKKPATKKKAPAKKKVVKKRRPAKKRVAKKAPAKKKAKKKAKKPLSVPVDIGIGPAVHFITGAIQDDGPQYGLKLSVQAIIDQAMIKANIRRVPKKYRSMARGLKEVRISPSPFIPDTLFLSPKLENTGMWGVNFRPISIGLPLLRVPRLHIGIGLDLTYSYIYSDLPTIGTTHFLRPGLDATADLEIPFSKSFLISVGWASMFYPPQRLGGPIFELGDTDESVWHIGQAYLKLHFRFPYRL